MTTAEQKLNFELSVQRLTIKTLPDENEIKKLSSGSGALFYVRNFF